MMITGILDLLDCVIVYVQVRNYDFHFGGGGLEVTIGGGLTMVEAEELKNLF